MDTPELGRVILFDKTQQPALRLASPDGSVERLTEGILEVCGASEDGERFAQRRDEGGVVARLGWRLETLVFPGVAVHGGVSLRVLAASQQDEVVYSQAAADSLALLDGSCPATSRF